MTKLKRRKNDFRVGKSNFLDINTRQKGRCNETKSALGLNITIFLEVFFVKPNRSKIKLTAEKTAVLLLLAALTGALTGLVCSVFGKGLLFIESFRNRHLFMLVPFLGASGVVLVKAYHKWGGQCYKGMGLVFETGTGKSEYLPRRFLPFTFLATWLTHFFGGSSGREGVAVQIGASVGFNLGEISGDMRIRKLLLICGMASGFAGLFGTPFAAVFFALEVLCAGKMAYEALVPVCVSAAVAFAMHHLLGLHEERVPLAELSAYDLPTVLRVAAAGFARWGSFSLVFWSNAKTNGFID